MARSKLKPTLEEAFAIGKLEGQRDAFSELLDLMVDEGLITSKSLRVYLTARLKTINTHPLNNPFKQKDSK